jgi:methionyl-tRNA formyltransferase
VPLLLETINRIAENVVTYAEQDDSKATRAPKLKKSDGFLNFSENAEILRRKILGLWSWPGAAAIYVSKKTAKQQRVTIAMAEVVEIKKVTNLPAGTLDENLNVVCGENALKVIKIKPDGSTLMGFKDFINGRATQPGDMFVTIDK